MTIVSVGKAFMAFVVMVINEDCLKVCTYVALLDLAIIIILSCYDNVLSVIFLAVTCRHYYVL